MNTMFWENCWKNNRIGFHEYKPNPIFVRNLDRLDLKSGDRILIPLCGKTLDVSWLLSEGYKVVGVELSELAVQQLFDAMGVEPEISCKENLKLYRAHNVDIWVGNFFDVTLDAIGKVDAILDRGSLVALPEDMRDAYATHLKDITENTQQLLVCYSYEQDLRAGPPFSINLDELNRHYESSYKLQLLESSDASIRLSAEIQVEENVWLMRPK